MKLYLAKRNLKYYRLPVFISIVFILECLALNAHKWYTPEYQISAFMQERIDSTDDPVTKQLLVENCQWAIEKETKERFVYAYLILGGVYFLIFMKCRFYPDWVDECFSGLWIFSCIIDFMNRLENWNTDPISIDVWGFSIAFFILYLAKFYLRPLIKLKHNE